MAAHSLKSKDMELIEKAVCTDCINLIANGELPPDSTEELDKLLIDKTADFCYDGEELGFDYKPCQCCQRKLGGDRFKAFQRMEV